MKKAAPACGFRGHSGPESGRSGRIRTCDPLHPMQVRYQAAPRSESSFADCPAKRLRILLESEADEKGECAACAFHGFGRRGVGQSTTPAIDGLPLTLALSPEGRGDWGAESASQSSTAPSPWPSPRWGEGTGGRSLPHRHRRSPSPWPSPRWGEGTGGGILLVVIAGRLLASALSPVRRRGLGVESASPSSTARRFPSPPGRGVRGEG